MKIYGETIFDIIYLLMAIISGIIILIKHKNNTQKLMGLSVLILGLGDSFHLIPRVLSYFTDNDLSMYLGIGKLVTSVTMTIFYIFMYYIYVVEINSNENKKITLSVYILSIVRIILCLLPQNNWLTNDGPLYMGILRNIPFLMLGLLIIYLYFKDRRVISNFKNIWLYITLSFLFYIPVVLGASKYSILGMFMLPKTVCYMLIINVFNKYTKN